MIFAGAARFERIVLGAQTMDWRETWIEWMTFCCGLKWPSQFWKNLQRAVNRQPSYRARDCWVGVFVSLWGTSDNAFKTIFYAIFRSGLDVENKFGILWFVEKSKFLSKSDHRCFLQTVSKIHSQGPLIMFSYQFLMLSSDLDSISKINQYFFDFLKNRNFHQKKLSLITEIKIHSHNQQLKPI